MLAGVGQAGIALLGPGKEKAVWIASARRAVFGQPGRPGRRCGDAVPPGNPARLLWSAVARSRRSEPPLVGSSGSGDGRTVSSPKSEFGREAERARARPGPPILSRTRAASPLGSRGSTPPALFRTKPRGASGRRRWQQPLRAPDSAADKRPEAGRRKRSRSVVRNHAAARAAPCNGERETPTGDGRDSC